MNIIHKFSNNVPVLLISSIQSSLHLKEKQKKFYFKKLQSQTSEN